MIFTEKFRPKVRSEIVGNKDTIDQIFALVATSNMPHMIFHGPAGNGKTSTAYVIARQIFGEFLHSNFLEMNASDLRKIDNVREEIKTFAKTNPLSASFKILFLDEFDLTAEAQQALRRTLEKYSDITKFIISTNYLEKIIEPIQSRCVAFRFGPISADDMTPRLAQILRIEKNYGAFPDTELPALQKIAELSNGDMRKALNHLQLLLSQDKLLTPELVSSIKTTDYGKLIYDSIASGRFLEARNKLREALELGYTERYIIGLLHLVYISEQLDYNIKANTIFSLAEADYNMTQSVNAMLAMDKLLFKLIEIMRGK